MNSRKFSLRSLLGWIVKKRDVSVISLSANKRGSTAACGVASSLSKAASRPPFC